MKREDEKKSFAAIMIMSWWGEKLIYFSLGNAEKNFYCLLKFQIVSIALKENKQNQNSSSPLSVAGFIKFFDNTNAVEAIEIDGVRKLEENVGNF